jgi:serine/threonine protein kinase
MSPERISGQPYSFASDVWGCGLTLLACIVGKHPYYARASGPDSYWSIMQSIQEQPVPIPSSLTPSLTAFLTSACTKDPDGRSSAAELLNHRFLTSYPHFTVKKEATSASASTSTSNSTALGVTNSPITGIANKNKKNGLLCEHYRGSRESQEWLLKSVQSLRQSQRSLSLSSPITEPVPNLPESTYTEYDPKELRSVVEELGTHLSNSMAKGGAIVSDLISALDDGRVRRLARDLQCPELMLRMELLALVRSFKSTLLQVMQK